MNSSSSSSSSSKETLREILWSARILACFRAYEFKNTNNPLIQDPFAELLANMKKRKIDKTSSITKEQKSIDNSFSDNNTDESDSSNEILYDEFQNEDEERKIRPIHLIRTRAIDEIIENTITNWNAAINSINNSNNMSSNSPNNNLNNCRGQLILLGSGLDSRPYRMNCLSNIRVFEIDFPSVLQYKRGKLMNFKPKTFNETVQFIETSLIKQNYDNNEKTKSKLINKNIEFREYDESSGETRREYRVQRAQFRKLQKETENQILSNNPSETKENWTLPWVDLLSQHGFQSDLPSLFVAEGVLMYLNSTQVSAIISACAKLTNNNNSLFVSDYVNNACLLSGLAWYRLFKFSCDDNDDIKNYLTSNGWQTNNKEIQRIGPSSNELNYKRFLAKHMEWRNPKTAENEELYAYIVTAHKNPINSS